MKSPAEMETIQIDITNACNKRCSNCTRFCGNHKSSFFMDYSTFTRAVESLDGYDGVIGIMGGEPTLHPQFDRFVDFLQKRFGLKARQNRLVYPQKDFIKEMRKDEFECRKLCETESGRKYKKNGIGLWSNMGVSYRRKYEIINDTFDVQFLNDHINSSYHQPGLFSRKDLNISDDEWLKLRDKCWVQNEWSATITPKGCFFCEIAGALDMLFDGPGGWPIEPGWWKRKPEEFTDQLHWCEICGFALNTFMRDAEDEIDDVSPTLFSMLEQIGSPRLKQKKINLVKIENGIITDKSGVVEKHFTAAQPYIEHYEDRFNENNSQLFVHNYMIDIIDSDKLYGIFLNEILKKAEDWILLCDSCHESDAKSEINRLINQCILNPGTLHIGNGFIFFSKQALSLKKLGFDRIKLLQSTDDLINNWEASKIVYLNDKNIYVKWKNSCIKENARYAIWGAGFSSEYIADMIKDSGGQLVMLLDRDEKKYGKKMFGLVVDTPDCVAKKQDEYDYLILANYSHFDDIKNQAIELGVPLTKIIMPYDLVKEE